MTGRTIALTSPRTRAETSSVVVEVKTMPGTMRALTASATAVTSQWIRKERIRIDYPTPPRLPTPAVGGSTRRRLTAPSLYSREPLAPGYHTEQCHEYV